MWCWMTTSCGKKMQTDALTNLPFRDRFAWMEASSQASQNNCPKYCAALKRSLIAILRLQRGKNERLNRLDGKHVALGLLVFSEYHALPPISWTLWHQFSTFYYRTTIMTMMMMMMRKRSTTAYLPVVSLSLYIYIYIYLYIYICICLRVVGDCFTKFDYRRFVHNGSKVELPILRQTCIRITREH